MQYIPAERGPKPEGGDGVKPVFVGWAAPYIPAMPHHIDKPWPRTPTGWTWDGYSRPIWSPAGFLARGDRYILVCACGRREDAPLERLVDEGKGDRPMHTFQWRCSCGERAIRVDLEPPSPTKPG